MLAGFAGYAVLAVHAMLALPVEPANSSVHEDKLFCLDKSCEPAKPRELSLDWPLVGTKPPRPPLKLSDAAATLNASTDDALACPSLELVSSSSRVSSRSSRKRASLFCRVLLTSSPSSARLTSLSPPPSARPMAPPPTSIGRHAMIIERIMTREMGNSCQEDKTAQERNVRAWMQAKNHNHEFMWQYISHSWGQLGAAHHRDLLLTG